MAQSQWQEAYEYMKNVGSLTSLTALSKLGIISFPKRICEMEGLGIKVDRKRIDVIDRNGNIKKVIEYSLMEDKGADNE